MKITSIWSNPVFKHQAVPWAIHWFQPKLLFVNLVHIKKKIRFGQITWLLWGKNCLLGRFCTFHSKMYFPGFVNLKYVVDIHRNPNKPISFQHPHKMVPHPCRSFIKVIITWATRYINTRMIHLIPIQQDKKIWPPTHIFTQTSIYKYGEKTYL